MRGKHASCWIAIFITAGLCLPVLIVGVITLRMGREPHRPSYPGMAEALPGTAPTPAPVVPSRAEKLSAWVAFANSDPGMTQIIQRVEVHPGSAKGIGITVYLQPQSAVGKAAAKDPGAEPVELAAKMIAAHLWENCRDGELREVNVGIRLGKREIGVAATGYMGETLTTIYLPTGLLDE